MSDVAPKINGGYDSPQTIYEVSTTKNHQLGTRGTLSDGRIFHYARSSGAAITRGSICRSAAEDGTIGHTLSVAAVAAAAGANSAAVTIGALSIPAGRFEDGSFIVIDGTNSGQCRRIEYHASATNSADLTLLLDAPLEAALTTSEEVSLVANPFADVVITPGDAVVQVAGVPQVNVAAGTTDAQYFWLQTYGRGAVLGDNSTFVLATAVCTATSTTDDAGQCTIVVSSASTASIVPRLVIGTVASLGDSSSDGDFRLIDMRIR